MNDIKNSIPRIIHFCWFGKGRYSDMIAECIASWSRELPNYEIMVWNEESFDVNQCDFTREAYGCKKWAFVSDFVRLYALNEYGGIYLDTDVEVIRDFSDIIADKSFVSSFTEGGLIATSFIAASKHHPFICKLLEYYENRHFCDENNTMDMLMNPIVFTRIAVQMYDLDITVDSFDNKEISIFPSEYFQPYRKNNFGSALSHSKYHITSNTYVIHKDAGSWSKELPMVHLIKAAVRLLLPEKVYVGIKRSKNIKILKCTTGGEN